MGDEHIKSKVRELLENERHRVNEEIKNYPTPIPACDAQFNYLLEERTRIAEELEQLKNTIRGRAWRSSQGEFIWLFMY